MAHSMTWNGTALSTYGLIVRLATPAPTLSRTYESKQTQDRAWAGKGQGAPSVFNLPVVIVGTSSSNLLSRVSTVRGLLDQEDECTLAFDMYTDRYWMAKFDSMTGDYTSPTTWEGTIIFTCHDRKAYATAASTQTETLTENISADYGGTVQAIAFDDDYVYVAGGTTNAVQQLSKIDLSLVATGPDYGGTIYCLCCDSTNGYIYYGGDGGAGQYDMCQLLTSDMTTIVRGPDYGGIIYACAQYGNYIYYGGNGGAGEYDIAKLLKSDMTTIVRSADYGGIIYAMAVNSTDVFIGGATTQTVNSYLISDLSADDTSDGYGATIRGIAVDATNCYWCGELDEVWWTPLTDLTAETQSADLGGDLYAIAVDDDYIYVVGVDNVVYKLDIDFAASASYVAKSEDYGGDINAMAIDTVNQWLYIGGATTQTVWKLDSRHLEEIWQSESIGAQIGLAGRIIYEKGAYIYTIFSSAAASAKVIKIRKTDGEIIASSSDYGGAIYALSGDDDGYIYCGGSQTGTYHVWKLDADNLTFIAQGPDYGGIIYTLCCDSNGYIYYGGNGGLGQYDMCKLLTSNMTTIVRGPDYGGVIVCCCCDDSSTGYIYYGGSGGAGQYDMCKLLKSDMATIVRGNDYGDVITGCDLGGIYIFYGGIGGIVTKTDIATMAVDVDSAALGGDIYSIKVDALYNYASIDNPYKVFKLLNSDMTRVANTESYGSLVYMIEIDDGYIYVQNYIDKCIDKLDKRVLWQRSDHEITITSAGTASSGLDFASTASQDNYSLQQYGNQTTGDEFDWEGTQASGEELEVDSELWYCTLEGDSAMSGVSGEFLTLSPGANTLYLENVTGSVKFDWTDRFA